jgi:hypothetical protein
VAAVAAVAFTIDGVVRCQYRAGCALAHADRTQLTENST